MNYEQKMQRVAEGKCNRCYTREACDGVTLCKRCLEYFRRRSENKKSQGVCSTCGNPAVNGKLRCKIHLEKNALTNKKRTWKRNARGVCVKCSGPCPGGGWRCPVCESIRRIGRAINGGLH